ncbi:cytochrome P450 [Myxozyma melibiosi]|uniref:sterol 14alpha-demethylase n=1 Tax=Myxozyma melibiosi TaxID=54550 RepID=A0ABR1EZN3_9ASCO
MMDLWHTLVSILFILAPVFLYHNVALRSTSAEPPLIKGRLPFIGVALNFVSDPQPLLEKMRAKLGWIYTLYLGGRRMTIVSDPVLGIRQVYSQGRIFDAGEFFRYLNIKLFNYTERINSNSEFQEALVRHVITYLSSPANIDAIAKDLQAEYRVLVDENSPFCNDDYTLQNGTTVDLYGFARKTMYVSAAYAVFGKSFPADSLYRNYINFEDSLLRFIKGYPYVFNRSGQDARKAVLADLGDFFIDQEKASRSSPFITGISALFDKFGYMTREDLSGYFLSIVFASKSNSIPIAFWYLAFIVHDPEFKAEIIELIKKNYVKETKDFDWKALYSDPLLNSAFKETTRLASNITSGRAITRDAMIKVADSKDRTKSKEYYLRKGDSVLILSSLTHWDPDAFPDPMAWHARRFLPDSSSSSNPLVPHEHADKDTKEPQWRAYIPWGGGGHMCPGRHLAIVEAVTQLVYMLWYFDIEPVSKTVPKMKVGENYGGGVLKPASAYTVKIRRRSEPLVS